MRAFFILILSSTLYAGDSHELPQNIIQSICVSYHSFSCEGETSAIRSDSVRHTLGPIVYESRRPLEPKIEKVNKKVYVEARGLACIDDTNGRAEIERSTCDSLVAKEEEARALCSVKVTRDENNPVRLETYEAAFKHKGVSFEKLTDQYLPGDISSSVRFYPDKKKATCLCTATLTNRIETDLKSKFHFAGRGYDETNGVKRLSHGPRDNPVTIGIGIRNESHHEPYGRAQILLVKESQPLGALRELKGYGTISTINPIPPEPTEIANQPHRLKYFPFDRPPEGYKWVVMESPKGTEGSIDTDSRRMKITRPEEWRGATEAEKMASKMVACPPSSSEEAKPRKLIRGNGREAIAHF